VVAVSFVQDGRDCTNSGNCPASSGVDMAYLCDADRSAGARCVDDARLANKATLFTMPVGECGNFNDDTKNKIGGGSIRIRAGLSSGAIAGIVIGVVAGVALAAVGGLWYTKKGPFAPKSPVSAVAPSVAVKAEESRLGGTRPAAV
jgi:hypothetical protein